MIKVSFLNGNYYAADLVAQFKALFSDGVCSGMGVAAHVANNMSVDVSIGNAIKAGLFLNSDSLYNVLITNNTSGNPRIDVIAADMDNSSIIAVPGSPASSPTAPVLTGNKIALFNVYVGNNVSVINSGNLTDVRLSAFQANMKAYINGYGLGAGPSALTDASSLSAYGDTGFYNVGAIPNVPESTGGVLIHMGRDGRPCQIFQGYANNTMWIRAYGSGGWSSWAPVLTVMASTLPLKNAGVTSSIFTFALSCPDGLTPFKTTAGISGCPTSKGMLDYSFGHIYASGNYKTIEIISRTTGIIHTNMTTDGSTWIGWTAYTAVVPT